MNSVPKHVASYDNSVEAQAARSLETTVLDYRWEFLRWIGCFLTKDWCVVRLLSGWFRLMEVGLGFWHYKPCERLLIPNTFGPWSIQRASFMLQPFRDGVSHWSLCCWFERHPWQTLCGRWSSVCGVRASASRGSMPNIFRTEWCNGGI